MTDADLQSLRETLDLTDRDTLRRILFHDRTDRDAIASELIRYRDRERRRLGSSSKCDDERVALGVVTPEAVGG